MPETVLIADLDRIEHEYSNDRYYFSFMLSTGCILDPSDIPKNVNWELFQPWSWDKFEIKFGSFDKAGNPKVLPTPIDILTLNVPSAKELEDSLNFRKKSIYGKEKDLNAAPGKSALWWDGKTFASAANETKLFPEFVINESSRPVPVPQALNLNYCFSILKTDIQDLIDICTADGQDIKDLKFFAFLNFKINNDTVAGTAAALTLNPNNSSILYSPIASHKFSGRGNFLTFADIHSPYKDSWIRVNVDFDDWLGTLKKNLSEGLDLLNTFAEIVFHKDVTLTNAQADKCLRAIRILIANRLSFSAPNDLGWLNLLKVSNNNVATLNKAINAIKNEEKKFVVTENSDHTDAELTASLNAIPQEIKSLFNFLVYNSDPKEKEKIITRLYEQISATSEPKALGALLAELLKKHANGDNDILQNVFPPNSEELSRNNAFAQKLSFFSSNIAKEIELSRLALDPKDLPAKIIELSTNYWLAGLKALTKDDTSLKALFTPYLTAKAEILSRLVPEAADIFKTTVPRSEVQPVSLDLVALVQSGGAGAKIAKKLTGVGILLREKKVGQEWKCLNNAAIVARVFDPANTNAPPKEYFISERSVTPLKLSKNNGVLQTSAVYNNQPLSSSSAMSRLIKATGQEIVSSEATGKDDYLFYDLSKQNGKYETLPMLKYGRTYQALGFFVDKCGALPKALAKDPAVHPGLLKNSLGEASPGASFPADPLPKETTEFIYQRQVHFGAPRLASVLPSPSDKIVYLNEEVRTFELAVAASSQKSEILISHPCKGPRVDTLFKEVQHFDNVVATPPAPKFKIQCQNPKKEIVYTIEVDFVGKSISIAAGAQRKTGTLGNSTTFKLSKRSDAIAKTTSISIFAQNDQGTFKIVDFSDNTKVLTINNELLDEFRFILSAKDGTGTMSGIVTFEGVTSYLLNIEDKVEDQTELFELAPHHFVFLQPEDWTKDQNVLERIILPASTSFENFDRWYMSEPNPDLLVRAMVVKEYFDHIVESEITAANPDAKFAINDPTCDKKGLIELVKVFPLNSVDTKPKRIQSFFDYDWTNPIKSLSNLKIHTKKTFSQGKLDASTKGKINVEIPEGELWELRIFTCVKLSEFGPTARCHPELAGTRTEKFGGEDYYLFSPTTIRIETAIESPLFVPTNQYLFLESLRDCLTVSDADGVLNVRLDRAKLSKTNEKFHYLFSTVKMHWQSWKWDGKTLSSFPYRHWDFKTSTPVNSTSEAEILNWEAREFARPETDHFTTSNRLTIHDKELLLFKLDLSTDTRADFYRFAITIESRYRPLRNQLRLSTFDLLNNKKNCWNRYFVRSKLTQKLPSPLVKIVIPLTNRFDSSPSVMNSNKCPDLLVILNEPPFRYGGIAEKIYPEVCDVKVPDAVSTVQNLSLLEFGPDPILSKNIDPSLLVTAGSEVWSNTKELGGRQFGFFHDLGTDEPRFTASALVLPSPEFKDNEKLKGKDFAWYMMKLQFRRVLDFDGTKPNSNFKPDLEFGGYASEPTPATWVQYLPDAGISRLLLDQGLTIKNKQFFSRTDSTAISPESIGWTSATLPVERTRSFDYCAVVTKVVPETDGVTDSEKYNSVFKFKLNGNGELESAEIEKNVQKLIDNLPDNGCVRILEIQTDSKHSLNDLFRIYPNKSIWDILFFNPDDASQSKDGLARITRISQPFTFKK